MSLMVHSKTVPAGRENKTACMSYSRTSSSVILNSFTQNRLYLLRTQPPARISAASGMVLSLSVNLSLTKSLTCGTAAQSRRESRDHQETSRSGLNA